MSDKLGCAKPGDLVKVPNAIGFWTACGLCKKAFWFAPGGIHFCDGPITFEEGGSNVPSKQVMSFFDDRFIIHGPARIDMPRGHYVPPGSELELPKELKKSCRVVYDQRKPTAFQKIKNFFRRIK